MPHETAIDLDVSKEFGRGGFVYPLARVIRADRYLYYERRFLDHPRVDFFASVVVPELNFKASQYYSKGRPYRYLWYIDIAEAAWESPNRLRITDLYLDVVQFPDRTGYTVLDIDEFREAIEQKSISEAQVIAALRGLENVCGAFAANRGQFSPYLQRLMGIEAFSPNRHPQV